MRVFQSKIFLGISCFILGAVSFFIGEKLNHRLFQKTPRFQMRYNGSTIDDSGSISGPSGQDPFAQMQRMQQQMMKQFGGMPPRGAGAFGMMSPNQIAQTGIGDMTRHEDDKFVYYEISTKGLNKQKFNVKVHDGQISISGQTETKNDSGNTEALVSSSFQRSFPVPPRVDANKVQMENQKDKLVIKFPKTA